MKNSIISLMAIVIISFESIAQDLSPYIKIGETNETMQQAFEKITKALESNSFTILGSYNPSNKSTLKVIAFTRTDLKEAVVKVADRGALAAVFKVGFVSLNGKVTISYTNPEYILRAYLRDNYNIYKGVFQKIEADLKTAFSTIGREFKPFGGAVKAENLKKYHYKIMMPYFTDPIMLNEFSSFENGKKIIEDNLKAKKGETVLVYKLIFEKENIAIFGIGLQNNVKGEAHFLPIIGENNIAAMPYEIILQDKKATMLHGKYRLALNWPELTMGTFMKIMSTPGDIEAVLKTVCK
ncbi:MAG: hypothetical protein COZ76_06475 [Flavobacteriales bacterium CG_4_8_14_3_um_filter_35_10]|nr:MAG: hypothetical protein COZ76_06475 [Flavobacteriales bacterium CG_4_8_14_3_um_filter_35_10]